MRHSTERILTTHVGSLPRSQAVTDVLFAREKAEIRDPDGAAQVIADAVRDVVRRQVGTGVDIVSDGEMSKISYATYIADRFDGFGGDTPREPGQDLIEFPRLLTKLAERGSTAKYRRPRCIGEIRVKDTKPLQEDLANFRRAVESAKPAEAFLNAASAGVIALFQPNDYYPTQDAYLEAIAEAMRTEYEAIVSAGFLLQIDAPDLGMGRHTMYRNDSVDEYLECAQGTQPWNVLYHACDR
jgi:5-methyltetrahydropteroyltriglutamate--homocysteine methyltransferase